MFLDTETYVPSEFDTQRQLKPSQAMRIGAKLRPKCDSAFFTYRHGHLFSCAIGAMWEGYGNEPLTIRDDGYVKIWEWVDGLLGYNIADKVYHLSDAGYSREWIADWLEAIGK